MTSYHASHCARGRPKLRCLRALSRGHIVIVGIFGGERLDPGGIRLVPMTSERRVWVSEGRGGDRQRAWHDVTAFPDPAACKRAVSRADSMGDSSSADSSV